MTATTLRRHRVSTTPASASLGSLVAQLRRDRRLTQTALAKQAGLKGSSTLSRLESGIADNISRSLIEALARELQADVNQLWAAAGALPPEAAAQLAPFHGAYRPDLLLEVTTPAVRRAHLRSRAEKFLADAGLDSGARVKVEELAGALTPTGRRVEWIDAGAMPRGVSFDSATIRVRVKPVEDTESEDPAEQATRAAAQDSDRVISRFLAAHASAHILLGDDGCEWPVENPPEIAADDFACYLLVPAALLDRALRRALNTPSNNPAPDGWHPSSFGLIDRTALYVAAPSWVVLRRMAEDDSLQAHAQESTREAL